MFTNVPSCFELIIYWSGELRFAFKFEAINFVLLFYKNW